VNSHHPFWTPSVQRPTGDGFPPTRIGYAPVSTSEQKLQLELDALDAAECEKTYTDAISGRASSRTELDTCLEHLREGDTLVVWRMDRFGRSLKDPDVSTAQICDRFDVSKATLYRYVGPDGKRRK
jgi:DNA invertase Pin-like site-specific DNA recombinase